MSGSPSLDDDDERSNWSTESERSLFDDNKNKRTSLNEDKKQDVVSSSTSDNVIEIYTSQAPPIIHSFFLNHPQNPIIAAHTCTINEYWKRTPVEEKEMISPRAVVVLKEEEEDEDDEDDDDVVFLKTEAPRACSGFSIASLLN